MIGKVLAATFLALLLAGSITAAVMLPNFTTVTDALIILSSALGAGGLVFLLNLFGIAFRPKYFGSLGIVIAGLLLAYGIYVLVTMKSLFLPVRRQLVPVIGGVSTGVGAVGLMTSAGILTM